MVYAPPVDEVVRRYVDGIIRCYVWAERDDIRWAANSIARSGWSLSKVLEVLLRYPGPRAEVLAERLRQWMA